MTARNPDYRHRGDPPRLRADRVPAWYHCRECHTGRMIPVPPPQEDKRLNAWCDVCDEKRVMVPWREGHGGP